MGAYGFYDALEQVCFAEERGFASVSWPEAHGISYNTPSPMLSLAAVASHTSRIMLGTSVIIASQYNPVRIAEEAAMLDVISNGRFTLGAAIGYRPYDFELLKAQVKNRGALFEESIQFWKKLWSVDSVDFHGRYLTYEGASIQPRPTTPGGPPIYVGGYGDLTIMRAATMADGWLPGGTAHRSQLHEMFRKYNSHLESKNIKREDHNVVLGRTVIIAETREEAFQQADQHLMAHYRDYAGRLQYPNVASESPEDLESAAGAGKDRFIIGSPEDVAAELRAYSKEFGVDHINCGITSGGPPHEVVMKRLELLANEVLPALEESGQGAHVPNTDSGKEREIV